MMSDEKPTLTKQAMAAYEAAIKHSHGECTFVTEALALIPALVREVERLTSDIDMLGGEYEAGDLVIRTRKYNAAHRCKAHQQADWKGMPEPSCIWCYQDETVALRAALIQKEAEAGKLRDALEPFAASYLDTSENHCMATELFFSRAAAALKGNDDDER